MKRSIQNLLILGFILACIHVHAKDEADVSSSPTLKVITYNVQFLPGPASIKNNRAEPSYRAGRIAAEMAQFDIVALQETFEPKHRQEIIDGLHKEWGDSLNHFASPKVPPHIANGGCLILTQFPIAESNALIFKNFSKPNDWGFRADGFAAKGVIHTKLSIDTKNPKRTLDIFVTHLEARDNSLRPLQYAETAEFIKKHRTPDTPFLLLGDLNTKGMESFRNDPDSQYTALMKTLTEATPVSPVIDLWPHFHPEALGGTTEQESADIGKRIDYVILNNPKAPALNLVPQKIEVHLYQDEKVVALSDHNAVVAEFNLEPPH